MNEKLIYLFIAAFLYSAGYYLNQYSDSGSFFGTDVPKLPQIEISLPQKPQPLTAELRNLFEFAKPKVIEKPVKKPEVKPEVKQEKKPEIKPEIPKIEVTGDFTGLSLMGIFRVKKKKTSLWEFEENLYRAASGEVFSRFMITDILTSEVMIKDMNSGVEKGFSLNLETGGF